MNKLLASVAVATFMAAAMSASASIVFTPVPTSGPTIGIIDPANPGTLNTVYVTSGSGAIPSQSFVFTFGMYLPGGILPVTGYHFNFIYDNSSLEVVHANNVHPGLMLDNFASSPGVWPNPSSGIVTVSSLIEQGTTFFNQFGVVPFFQVTLHHKAVQESQVNSFGMNFMNVTSDGVPKVTPSQFTYHGGLVHAAPEPSTLALLGGGFALLGGLITRRRRMA